jgi:hypothetical protein
LVTDIARLTQANLPERHFSTATKALHPLDYFRSSVPAIQSAPGG